jgi:RimJ/RimL family protein N-acetyltransferase
VPEITLIPATARLLADLRGDPPAFEAAIGSPIPAGWPEFPEAVDFTLSRLRTHPEEAGWWMQLFLDAPSGVLVGSGGFAGPPLERTVEIGYELAPAFRGRGLGTASAAALVAHAVRTGAVDAVVAHTLRDESASTSVLARNGFERIADVRSAEHGHVWRWRWERDPT